MDTTYYLSSRVRSDVSPRPQPDSSLQECKADPRERLFPPPKGDVAQVKVESPLQRREHEFQGALMSPEAGLLQRLKLPKRPSMAFQGTALRCRMEHTIIPVSIGEDDTRLG
ncbi:hypothetical protein PV04_02684 [Phialophora macrospora]|uniref:Uncharacterized protein n=1 Tax=Phialophora macrospora TaxID=1851006 RepID=A0A0D2E7X0_9EURO|nr:hypothetical protein PV04_02684 [Phialophora macrospora]